MSRRTELLLALTAGVVGVALLFLYVRRIQSQLHAQYQRQLQALSAQQISQRVNESMSQRAKQQTSKLTILSHILPKGKVACALPVNEVSSLGYHIQPGDRIDIYVTESVRGVQRREKEQTRLVAQEVLVMAVGSRTKRADGGEGLMPYNSITVLLTPEQAKKVIQAKHAGTLDFVLRHSGGK